MHLAGIRPIVTGRLKEIGSLDTKSLFALAETDDAAALLAAVVRLPPGTMPVNENGETLFLFSTYRGRANCVQALKQRGGLSLHEAAAAGDTTRIETCLSSAAWAIQTLSGDGWTALHLAAFLGHEAALQLLLDRGADARQWGRAADANLAIHAACAGRRLGKSAFAKLIEATGDPDIPQRAGYTPLMIAAANGSRNAVDALLSAGADQSLRTHEGKSAADFARDRGQVDLAALLG
jgi:ankyrin repeat protein